jgi:hypothetical protein
MKIKKQLVVDDMPFMIEIDRNGNHEIFQWFDKRVRKNKEGEDVDVPAGYYTTNHHYGTIREALRGMLRIFVMCRDETDTVRGFIERLEALYERPISLTERSDA